MVGQSDERDALRAGSHGMWAAVAGGWAQHAEYADARGAPGRRTGCSSWPASGPGERVLELACGPGGLGLAAAERVGPRGEVVLSDVVAEMTAIAAGRAARRGLRERAAPACSTSSASTSPTARYDVVLCREGLMFAVDPAAAAREIAACCAPAGGSRSRSGGRASEPVARAS